MSVQESARAIASRILHIERDMARTARLRQGTVAVYDAGPPRTVNITVEGGSITAVPLLTHHTAPSVGDVVWIKQIGTGTWLYEGKQG